MSPIHPLQQTDPSQIGPYRIVGRLGQGGMGTVYAGMDGAGYRAAIKVAQPELAQDQDFLRRFAREIELQHRVRSAFTARVLLADTQASPPWMAMEYVPGLTLDAYVREHGPLSNGELLALATGLAEGIVAIHRTGIVHRDLKPSNIILSPEGPRIIDMGIGKALDDTKVTKTGMMVGTAAWLSPEQFNGEEASPAADVYAWGLIVAFAATSRLPYGTTRPDVLAVKIFTEHVDTSALPANLRATVDTALDKAPTNRPAAAEVLDRTAAIARDSDEGVSAGDATQVATAFVQKAWDVEVTAQETVWRQASTRLESGERAPTGVFKRKGLLMAGAVAGILVVAAGASLALRGGGGTPGAGAATQPTPSTPAATTSSPAAGDSSSSSAPTTPEASPKVGTGYAIKAAPITHDGLKVVVTKIETGVDGYVGFGKAVKPKKGTYLAVWFHVENRGKKQNGIQTGPATLTTKDGYEYGYAARDGWVVNPEGASSGSLNPGDSHDEALLFDVPKGTNAASIVLGYGFPSVKLSRE